jgi:hypothetical protein
MSAEHRLHQALTDAGQASNRPHDPRSREPSWRRGVTWIKTIQAGILGRAAR